MSPSPGCFKTPPSPPRSSARARWTNSPNHCAPSTSSSTKPRTSGSKKSSPAPANRRRRRTRGESGLRRDQSVRIDHELLRRALVKVLVSLRGLIQRDRLNVHRFGDLDLVVQDALHQLAVVLLHGALAGREGV